MANTLLVSCIEVAVDVTKDTLAETMLLAKEEVELYLVKLDPKFLA